MRLNTIFAAMLLAGTVSAAQAAPITYSLQGTFDGSIGGVVVYGDSFTWTITASTDQVFSGPGYLGVPALTSTLVATGFVPLTTTQPFYALFSTLGEGAFSTSGFSQEIYFGTPAMAGYDGLRAFGPVTTFFDPATPIATSFGDWLIDPASATTLTFQAIGGIVPEPVTLALFGAGLAGIGAMRRRKARS